MKLLMPMRMYGKSFKENVLEIRQLKKLEMDVYDKMVKNFSLYRLNIKITMCI